MAFSRIDTRDERLTALILGDLPNVVWTPTLSMAGNEQNQLQDNITFQIGTRFRYLGNIYELTAPMSIQPGNRISGWVYPNISTGQIEILPIKRNEDAGVATSRPTLGTWVRANGRQVFLPTNPNQDREYPINQSRHIFTQDESFKAIVVQDRAKIVFDASGSTRAVDTAIQNLESSLRKNGYGQLASAAISKTSGQVATVNLNRGIWTVASSVIAGGETARIWGNVAII